MAGTLSIVATPIGHLEDITLRALNVLRAVDLIAAEDTRRTGHLLAHFGISTRTISFHEHNARSRLPIILKHLGAGQSVALVSDAGTPMLSDPGLELVQACIESGLAVDAIPGASAPLTLAVVSGFPLSPWTILGFPPTRSKDRTNFWSAVYKLDHTVSFLEAPHRIVRTLVEMSDLFGLRPIVVGRELTKLHQTIYRGTVSSVVHAGVDARGEFTVMLGPNPKAIAPASLPEDQIVGRLFGEMTQDGLGRRAAVKALADQHGVSTRDVYAAIERSKEY